MRTCIHCHKAKPVDDFQHSDTASGGLRNVCRDCYLEQKRRYQARMRNEVSPEEKAEAARAYRAGMRKDKCAVCGSAIEGHGICEQCAEAVTTLGGLEGLKKAVRAVRHLTGE